MPRLYCALMPGPRARVAIAALSALASTLVACTDCGRPLATADAATADATADAAPADASPGDAGTDAAPATDSGPCDLGACPFDDTIVGPIAFATEIQTIFDST